jgi:Htaa
MTSVTGPRPGPRNLEWGIKSSFLSYLDGLGDSVTVTNDGVRRDVSCDTFIFPFDAYTELPGGGFRLEFRGDLRLKAHGGMLLVILMNPWLTMTHEGAELSVVDLMAWPDASRRETIGVSTGNPEERGSGVLEVPLQLTANGVDLFNNVYPAGTDLSPARLLLIE